MPLSEADLIAASLALGPDPRRLSDDEAALARRAGPAPQPGLTRPELAAALRRGADPLGDGLMAARSAAQRRADGAVYTPAPIVQAMVDWLARQPAAARVVDPGAGSGRFLIAAGLALPDAELVAVERDPVAALMLRANLQALGLAGRAQVHVVDFRAFALPAIAGRTAFIGNPPYVRHHDIPKAWKDWYAARFAERGIRASALAGLHLHFFLQTLRLARPGDLGAFITAAEWLDVNYGAALRRLLTDHLGADAVHVLQPAVGAFPGTATTAAITTFAVGAPADAPVRLRAVTGTAQLASLDGGTPVARSVLRAAPRWSPLLQPAAACGPSGPAGSIELGELFSVHRGQVTGANKVWIAGPPAADLPAGVLLPTVTKARDLIDAGARLDHPDALRRVVDLPPDLDGFDPQQRRQIERFLRWARAQGAHTSYIARHRKAWWAVGLRAPAPILCTYMARRPPQFTLNRCGARHINIAHGLYPRQPLPDGLQDRLVAWLNRHVITADGRTYAGGLTKFEPREVERLRIPSPDDLAAEPPAGT